MKESDLKPRTVVEVAPLRRLYKSGRDAVSPLGGRNKIEIAVSIEFSEVD